MQIITAVMIINNREKQTMKRQAGVRLDEDTFARLHALTAKTGKTAAFHIREAIRTHLEDLDDLHAAEQATTEHAKSGGRTLSLDELDQQINSD